MKAQNRRVLPTNDGPVPTWTLVYAKGSSSPGD